MKKAFAITLLVLILVPFAASAIPLNLTYPTFGKFDINTNQDLATLMKWLYAAIVIISGLAAFVMLVWGGIRWMSSAGSPTAISDARGRIQNALLGLLLVLASFLILQVVNPELTVLNIPGVAAPTSKVAPIGATKAPPDTFTFTVNGTNSATAKLGDPLTLEWSAIGLNNCQASGDSRWTGSKETSGSVSIAFDQEKTYSLLLNCRDPASNQQMLRGVAIVISSIRP